MPRPSGSVTQAAGYATRPVASSAPGAAAGAGSVVQPLFDWVINAQHNYRKVGVEITEDRAGHTNSLIELASVGVWPTPAPPWAATVNLPDNTGAAHTWHVAAEGTVSPAYYHFNAGKHVWMKWGDVSLTEDHGDYEWIIKHPSAPQGVTYYRDKLAEVARARAQVRGALGGLGLGNNLVLSHDANGLGSVAVFRIAAITACSSQITFESVDRAVTLNALLEGTTQGLMRNDMANRFHMIAADPDIVNTVNTAAARSPVPNVDMRLILAYIVGDLTHKIATLVPGAGWQNAAANFKDWRILFPKSHPSQVLFQAIDGPPIPTTIAAIRAAIVADQANILTDVRTLFADKLVGLHAMQRWQPAHFGGNDPGGHITNAIVGTAPPVGGATLEQRLNTFLNNNVAGFLATEFTNVVNALTDITGTTHIDVVRSSSFATHPGSSRGVAFEDRAEVVDSFPGLSTTYERIKLLVDRY